MEVKRQKLPLVKKTSGSFYFTFQEKTLTPLLSKCMEGSAWEILIINTIVYILAKT